MNILAIDYGTKRIGLAWVETGLGVVLPYGIVENTALLPSKLLEVILIDQPERVVVGLPKSTQGGDEMSQNEEKVRAFGDALAVETNVEVVYVDERFSSQQADNTPGDVSRDEKSAMIILESYLQTCKN